MRMIGRFRPGRRRSGCCGFELRIDTAEILADKHVVTVEMGNEFLPRRDRQQTVNSPELGVGGTPPELVDVAI